MKRFLILSICIFIILNVFAQKTIKYKGHEYSLALRKNSIEELVLVKERFPVNVKITFIAFFKEEDIPKIHEKLGPKHTLEIQNSIVNSAARIVFGKFKLEELLSFKREMFENELAVLVSQKFVEYHIQLRDIIIEKIMPSEQIQYILEQKQIALQEIERQKYLMEAEKKKLEIKKMQIEAEAERNIILDKSLTDKVLQLKYIETLKKLAESSNAKVVIFSDEKMNIPKMLKED